MKKIKLFILLILPLFSIAQTPVPNTDTFSLQDVKTSVESHCSCTVNDLVSAFSNSVDAYFDPTYKGSKDRLTNFKNYTPYIFKHLTGYTSNIEFSSYSLTHTFSCSSSIPSKNILIISVLSKYERNDPSDVTYDGVNLGDLFTSNNKIDMYIFLNATNNKDIYIPNINEVNCLVDIQLFEYTTPNVAVYSTSINTNPLTVTTSISCNLSHVNLVYGCGLFSGNSSTFYNRNMSDNIIGAIDPGGSYTHALASNYAIQNYISTYSMWAESAQADENIYYPIVCFYAY